VWTKSKTSENLRHGRVVLMLAAYGGLHELRFEVTEVTSMSDPALATSAVSWSSHASTASRTPRS
jgi:hypothetical protein